MAIVLRNEGAKINSNINVTPMVDVMLVLLIIFMVITPMLPHGIPVDMVKTANPMLMPDADKSDALLVSIMRDGKIFLGNDNVTGEVLTQKVRDHLDSRVNKTVYIRADARARYGLIVEVVDDVRATGVDQLGLLTEKRERRIER